MYYWDYPIKKISKARSAQIHKVGEDKKEKKEASDSMTAPTTNFSSRDNYEDEDDEEEDDLLNSSNPTYRDDEEDSEEELESSVIQDLASLGNNLGSSKKSRRGRPIFIQDPVSSDSIAFVELADSPMNEIRAEFRKSIIGSISIMMTQNITKSELRAIFDFLSQLINKDPQPCIEVCE